MRAIRKVFAIIKFTFPKLKRYKYMSTVSSTFDTDLAQRRSNAKLAAPERKRDVDRGGERVRERERMRGRSSARVYARIVEFGPLLAFTACLMNFEKLAHGSPQ